MEYLNFIIKDVHKYLKAISFDLKEVNVVDYINRLKPAEELDNFIDNRKIPIDNDKNFKKESK